MYSRWKTTASAPSRRWRGITGSSLCASARSGSAARSGWKVQRDWEHAYNYFSRNRERTGQRCMTDKLKIVLVDDQSLCRRGLSELLTNCYDFNVLGAVGTLDEL